MQQLDLFGTIEKTKPDNNKPVSRDANKALVAPDISPQPSPQPKNEVLKKDLKSDIPEPQQKENEVQKKIKPVSKRGRKSFKDMNADIVMVDVPGDEVLFQKQYYPISEVAQWFHVNQSLIRYWENEFDILKPRKTRKGDRLFRPEDVKNLQLIYLLLRERKYSIEGAKQYLKDNKQKADVQMQLIQSLTKFRSFLLEWKAILGA